MALVPIYSQAIFHIFSILQILCQTACKMPIQGQVAFKVITLSLFHAKNNALGKGLKWGDLCNEVPHFPFRWRHHFL